MNFWKVREFFYEYKRKKVRRKFPWFFGKIYFKSYYRLNFWENIWRFLVSSINFELFEEFDFARTLEWANLVNYQILRATNFILNLFVETPTLKKSNNKALLSRVYWHRAPSHQSENSIPFRVSLFNADLLSKKGAYTLQQFSYLQYILTICLFCKFFIFALSSNERHLLIKLISVKWIISITIIFDYLGVLTLNHFLNSSCFIGMVFMGLNYSVLNQIMVWEIKRNCFYDIDLVNDSQSRCLTMEFFLGDSFGKYFGIECRPSPWWLKHRVWILDSLKHKYRIVCSCSSPQISHFTKPMLPNYQYFPQQHETVQYFK